MATVVRIDPNLPVRNCDPTVGAGAAAPVHFARPAPDVIPIPSGANPLTIGWVTNMAGRWQVDPSGWNS